MNILIAMIYHDLKISLNMSTVRYEIIQEFRDEFLSIS